MLITLKQPNNFHYININLQTNRVHLLVPIVTGEEVGRDNTCKFFKEINAFFGGNALEELQTLKKTLELYLVLLEKDSPLFIVKKEQLAQIDLYINAIESMKKNVPHVFGEKSNLYNIVLRPSIQDPLMTIFNPVFSINRKNDAQGNPKSPLYVEMHQVFPALVLGTADPRTQLINNTLKILPPNATFDQIKESLKSQCSRQFKINIDFEEPDISIQGKKRQKLVVTKEYVDEVMRFDKTTNPEDYIGALLWICAPNMWTEIPPISPFYSLVHDKANQAESLSIMTQFYLGVCNFYCRTKNISDKNFGHVLDASPALSQQLVHIVANALSNGEDVGGAIVTFFNLHREAFKLNRQLNVPDKDAITQKFESTYRIVTATKENPHMDHFMLLDREAQGEDAIFTSFKASICTNAANIIPKSDKNKQFLAEIRAEARLGRDIVLPHDQPDITINVDPIALIGELSDEHWETLPKEFKDACNALPEFKVQLFFDSIAKGKQDKAQDILESSEAQQNLLKKTVKFTDYSGRTFDCTAYEYAYWAKDTFMQRMLECYMDDETRSFMLEKIVTIEQLGLCYEQNGIHYQNAHYDMSFILKNFTPNEFEQLQQMMGALNVKIQQATTDNYKNISFTATEFEVLKKILVNSQFTADPKLFKPSVAHTLSGKLKFDFHSLIIALDDYVTNFPRCADKKRHEYWMSVGRAQRDVPAHVAQECSNKSFQVLPSFTGEVNRTLNQWFPLSPGLGSEFAMLQAGWRISAAEEGILSNGLKGTKLDLAAVRHLDDVRNRDLLQSRLNLQSTCKSSKMTP